MEEGRLISDSEESCLDCDCHFSLSYFLYLGKNAYIQSVCLAKPAYFPTEHINNARLCSFFNFFCLVILPEKVIVPEKLTPSSAWSSSPVTPVDRSNAQPNSREVRFTEWTHRGLPWWLRRQRICLQCRRPAFSSWVRKIPWKRAWQPTPVFLSWESQGQKSLGGGGGGAAVHRIGESQIRLKWLSTHT